MDPNVLTISLSRWMSLPGLDLRTWERIVEAEQREAQAQDKNDLISSAYSAPEKLTSCKGLGRVLVGTVAKYFRDYVRRQKLEKYFRWCVRRSFKNRIQNANIAKSIHSGTTVTSVRPNEGDEEYAWIVDAVENDSGKRLQYRAKHVVLATGASDHSNRLGLPGEDHRCNWLTHDLNDLEIKLDCIAARRELQMKM